MDKELINSSDIIGMFCRLNMNSKHNLPIRPSEMGILIYTQKQTNSVTPLMISQFFGITKPSVSTIIKSLIKQKYLEKKISATDKRSYQLAITDKGQKLVDSTFNEYFKTIEVLNEKMGHDNFTQFIKLLNTANNILEANKDKKEEK
ncbi:MAG: MarR family transcriptional regulator [Fusobacteria bacterium]|nr:MAG: MarR family transcriptional regulator [Fusobacteriota bacterium]KAF0228510.1 MAG: MarR family transcriptional [Fusobacteriota bacterium]